MPFSLSGTTITQTGTDADLSGLSAIAGVVTQEIGDATQKHTVYFLDTLRIINLGTINHDPLKEMLVFGESITNESLDIRGTYNYGVATLISGFTQRSTGLGIVITRINSSNFGTPALKVRNNGRFNWFGGEINTGATVYFDAGSFVTIRDATIRINNPGQGQLIRSFTTDLDVQGLTKIGGAILLYVSPSRFEGYKPIHSVLNEGGRQDYSLLFYGNPSAITIRDFSGSGNPIDIGYIDNGQGIFLNAKDGSATTVAGWLGNSARSDTYIQFRKELAFAFTDTLGALSNPKIYCEDTDQGNRKNQNSNDDLSNKVYETQAVLGAANLEVVAGIYNALNSGFETTDVRFVNDLATFVFIEYGKTIAQTTVSLKGNGELTTAWTMVRDITVSQTDRAVTAAFNGNITNAFEFYDKASYYLETIFSGQKDFLVTRSGVQIDLGSLNLIIDPDTPFENLEFERVASDPPSPATGSLTFVEVGDASKKYMMGLAYTDGSANFSGIDYAFFKTTGGGLSIRELGSNRSGAGSVTAGDILEIKVTGTLVEYLVNGTVVYTSLVAANGNSLFPDVSADVVGTQIVDAQLNGVDVVWSALANATVSGTTLTLNRTGAWNSGAFGTAALTYADILDDVNPDTLVIKSSTFTGDLITTGTITLVNGAAVLGTRTDANGTVAPPVTVTITGLQPNSEVRAYVGTDPTTSVEIDGIENSGTSFVFTQTEAGNDGYIVIFSQNYQPIRLPLTYAAVNADIAVQQIFDRQYFNP